MFVKLKTIYVYFCIMYGVVSYAPVGYASYKNCILYEPVCYTCKACINCVCTHISMMYNCVLHVRVYKTGIQCNEVRLRFSTKRENIKKGRV